MSTLKNFSITFLFSGGLILFCSVMHIICSNAKFKYWSKMAFFWPSVKCDLRFRMMASYENKLPSSWPSKHGHVCFKRFHAESSDAAQDYQNQIFFSFFFFFLKTTFSQQASVDVYALTLTMWPTRLLMANVHCVELIWRVWRSLWLKVLYCNRVMPVSFDYKSSSGHSELSENWCLNSYLLPVHIDFCYH